MTENDPIERTYTNRELAEDYRDVAVLFHEGHGISHFAVAAIEVDVPGFYRQYGSLDNLKARGVGKKTKKLLQLILSQGVEGAKRTIKKEQDKK